MRISELSLFHVEKKKRKSARKQVKEAKDKQINDILEAMRSKKREIPRDWLRGFYSAMSVVESFKDE